MVDFLFASANLHVVLVWNLKKKSLAFFPEFKGYKTVKFPSDLGTIPR